MRPLNYRQRLFVEYYLGNSSGSAVDAARRAGYKAPHPEGARLLRKDSIRTAIDARVTEAAITANEVLARVADIATFDLLAFMNLAQSANFAIDLKTIRQLGLGHVIKRLRIRKDGALEIELESRLQALIKLGEYFKLWKREAEPQLTLVDLAKSLKEKHQQLLKEGYAEGSARRLQAQTGTGQ